MLERNPIGYGVESETLSSLLEDAVAGDRRSLAKALTAIEDGTLEFEPLQGNRPNIFGITGAPGVGKSCLVDALARHWDNQGKRVAILAIDPSSALSGGALLGDRVRMASADDESEVYVRSVATRNHPGGLPVRLSEMAELLSMCGFDPVLIETVGSGQAEIRIVSVADIVLLVEAPNLGDMVQAEKAGLMEIADIVVVNKMDIDGADKTISSIVASLEIESSPPPVLSTSATEGSGIEKLASALECAQPRRGAALAKARERLMTAWDANLLSREEFDGLIEAISSGEMTAAQAVSKVLEVLD